MKITRFPLIVAVLSLVACSDVATPPLEVEVEGVAFARPDRTGGGSTESDPTATFILPAESFGLTSDGEYANKYAEGVCGVHSKIFATTEASNSGDAIMHTSNPKYKDRRCPEYPRKVSIDYGTGAQPQLEEVFVNVRGIHNTTYSIAVGETAHHPMHVNPESSTICEGALIFNTEYQGESIQARPVYVTRKTADRWLVQTDDPTTNGDDGRAYCTSTGKYHPISASFEIVSSRELN